MPCLRFFDHSVKEMFRILYFPCRSLRRLICKNRLQESYRSQFYGFDFRMLFSVLKKEYPDYYRHAKEAALDSSELILFGGIFHKQEFDRICAWMFPVLARCAQFIPRRFSAYQNLFLEHLSPYLFTVYVSYWEKNRPYALTMPKVLREEEEKGRILGRLPEQEFFENASPREIFSQVDTLKHYRLDVPQVTLLAYELKKQGIPLPDGILNMQIMLRHIQVCVGTPWGTR